MAVRYIDVVAKSELFVPATRAYGNIAILGEGGTGATASPNVPQPLTAPPEPDDDPFGGSLSAAIGMAFKQSPGPMLVFAIRVDGAAGTGWDDALAAAAHLDAQIVVLAATTTNDAAARVKKLSDHVSTVSNAGGDGKERIGVAMLKKGETDVTSVVTNERMVYVAHRSDEDVAAAVAGVIAGYEPHISLLLKPVNVEMRETFTEEQIAAFAAETDPNATKVNWLTDPVLFPGRGIFMGEGYTADGTGTKSYIDIVRTLDDINFRLKAALIEAIGNLRVSRSGLRGVVTLARSVLSPLQAREVIDHYVVHIPLLVLLDKDPNSLTDDEVKEITAAHASRRVDMVVTVDYAGAIHRMHIDLVFK